jgi:hypothetical protein
VSCDCSGPLLEPPSRSRTSSAARVVPRGDDPDLARSYALPRPADASASPRPGRSRSLTRGSMPARGRARPGGHPRSGRGSFRTGRPARGQPGERPRTGAIRGRNGIRHSGDPRVLFQLVHRNSQAFSLNDRTSRTVGAGTYGASAPLRPLRAARRGLKRPLLGPASPVPPPASDLTKPQPQTV